MGSFRQSVRYMTLGDSADARRRPGVEFERGRRTSATRLSLAGEPRSGREARRGDASGGGSRCVPVG
ncbi:hypothetical protein ACFPRL_25225 [Pseudoclavibacter helvolus]